MPHTRLVPEFTFTAERLEQLKGVVPEAFADGKINWETLREVLGEHLESEELDAEHFGLFWPGKREARRLASLPSQGTLVPILQDGIDEGSTKNLFIEGENLEVLKLLQKAYAERVKMIYIDPPYNTGSDFVYSDNFTDSLDEYLRRSGQADDEGLLTSNPRADGRFHSNWLSMMYPRMRMARQVLAKDGVLLVSCNDIEAAHLKVMLAELFGEENFIGTFIWHNDGNIDNQSKIKCNHEYIHAFCKDILQLARPTVIDPNVEETSKLYNSEIENSITKNGPANPPSKVYLPAGFPATFAEGEVETRTNKWPHVHEPIVVSEHRLVRPAVLESGWSSRNLLQLFIDNGFVPIADSAGKETRFAVTTSGAIYIYKKRSEEQGHVLTVIRNVGTTKQSSSMLAKWGISFDWPKPVLLLRYLCEIFTNDSDVIMDFFAGSGTLAQAVMELNEKDGGSRSFVCVQFPELVSGSDYYSTLSDLAKYRIKCVSEEIACTDSDHDLGFRSFKLTKSHFTPWPDYAGDDLSQIQILLNDAVNRLVDGWTPEGLLTEVMLLEGFPLDSAVQRLRGYDHNSIQAVSSYTCGHRLLVCFNEKVLDSTIERLTFEDDDIFVCLDTALTDQAKLRLADQCTLKTI